MWPGIGNWGFLAVDGKSIGAELDRFLDPSRPKHSAQVNPLPTAAEKELQALAFRTLPVRLLRSGLYREGLPPLLSRVFSKTSWRRARSLSCSMRIPNRSVSAVSL